ncbi:acyl-phosphate glycerol 3-phosphate acyltransferase [Alsobacter soli]|uniref:Glycerol-3-phosphate acyltransferase n=1 Tax=Alsobacter soli TaxID=2109933 RepID=A0A2T1HMD8_9HYPH|nr:glycerol-3-phosphate 1-O-acyltransferase PlsY [Alsobacter soli]PSC02802.1 acyl-phosphate glycerol 3-phosphate acyltransferase [Alsobacter soli]
MLSFLAFLALGYLLGSIPFGVILTRIAGTEDIRSIGSGNIGATNVLRTGRKGLAAATLLGDALKGTLAVAIGARWGLDPALAAAAGAFVGHIAPVWLGFKGGKGVATFIGGLIGLAFTAVGWIPALAFAALWLGCAFATKYSSASALLASAATPLVMLALGHRTAALVYVALAGILWWKHSANIQRLMAGTEGRIGSKG